MIDEKVYQVVGINGYRSTWMTREDAHAQANRLREQMRVAGKVRVYYCDGREDTLS